MLSSGVSDGGYYRLRDGLSQPVLGATLRFCHQSSWSLCKISLCVPASVCVCVCVCVCLHCWCDSMCCTKGSPQELPLVSANTRPHQQHWLCVCVCECVCTFVGCCLATIVFIGKLPATCTGGPWVIIG